MLLCYPMGHEYIACHRALRQLAVRLAQAGFPALRFDFYGSGDSAGQPEEGSIDGWLRDVTHAILELRARHGRAEVRLAGLRLGATLALLHGAQTDARAMVLWNPVVSGRAYLEELIAMQKQRFPDEPATPALEAFQGILGFPLSHTLRAELEQIDLLQTRERPARHVLIVESGQEGGGSALERHLRELGVDVHYRFLDAPAIWRELPDQVVVPTAVIQLVVSWMKQV